MVANEWGEHAGAAPSDLFLGKITARPTSSAASPDQTARGRPPTARSLLAERKTACGVHHAGTSRRGESARQPQGVIRNRAVDPEGQDECRAVAPTPFEDG